jgi:hypothetical protein
MLAMSEICSPGKEKKKKPNEYKIYMSITLASRTWKGYSTDGQRAQTYNQYEFLFLLFQRKELAIPR